MSSDGAVRLVGSANARVGVAAGIEILSGGGSALDAVEAVTRRVEDNPDDHTVGYGGYPNLLGEVELDASIMEGDHRRAGAVGALRGYRYAVTVARAVMDRLPHVLVVGDGAARLAEEIGLAREDLLTPEAERVWRDGLDGTVDSAVARRMLSVMARLATDPERAAGTVNVIARDERGSIAVAVSTSGWAWKYPGRLGDTPVVGAGNYADSRYGAAACTGWGELAMRAGTARSIVAALALGVPLADACRAAMDDVVSLATNGHPPIMSLVALDANGDHAAWSTQDDATYVYWEPDMATYTEAARTLFSNLRP
ncbi:MAG: isoaspartyl peptidase/L-asparaginase [Acidimicrobiales bacterium]